MKLLIVDDSMIMRKSISLFVKKKDIEIVGEAANGKIALDLFKERDPDIVTMDLTMPEIDGYACIEEMIKIKPGVKILVITALQGKEAAIRAMELGAKGFLKKPINDENLEKSFNDLMNP